MGHFTVMPTFHPAAALRNPAWQELLEADFRMLGEYLERHPADAGIRAAREGSAADVRHEALPEVEE